jgi:hypothetical protein
MGRKAKQKFNFPSADQPPAETASLTDAELDAQIDCAESEKADAKTDRIIKDARKKKQAAQAVKEIAPIFTADQLKWVPNFYAALLAFILSFVLKYDYEVIFDAIKFDDEQSLALANPLARIASKYAPSEWAAMTAEIEICMALGMYSVRAYGSAKNAIEADRKRKQQMETQRPQSRQPEIVNA